VNPTTLSEKIKNIPSAPGCYIFRNQANQIIYVGKSKSLKERVRQYFQKTDEKEGKYKALAKEIADIEIILTSTERDALILECKLIKQHKPRYNTQLKRKKNYPFVLIDMKKEYPTISISGKYRQGTSCYGFFYNEDEAMELIILLNSIWQTPLCGKDSFPKDHRPCLNFHLKKCCAPCCGQISRDDYIARIKEIQKCLSGNNTAVCRRIKREMQKASAEMNFERAARLRDTIKMLELLQRKAGRLNTSLENSRVLLFFRAFREQDFSVFYIKDGLTKARIDIPADMEIEETKLHNFANQICNDKTLSEDAVDINAEKFLTTCLLDIIADKRFVVLRENCNEADIIKKLRAPMY